MSGPAAEPGQPRRHWVKSGMSGSRLESSKRSPWTGWHVGNMHSTLRPICLVECLVEVAMAEDCFRPVSTIPNVITRLLTVELWKEREGIRE